MKRATDIILSLVALILFAPVILIAAVLVRHYLGSPVIFSQTRTGLNGDVFTLYKLRSMADSRDKSGALLADQQRLSAFGARLRRTSIDELPTLWNVLTGHMSLVGPRPLLVEYLPLYSAEQFRRHEVKPGITGWAQVNGRNAISWADKFSRDVWYVDNRSMLLDFRILGMTIKKVLAGEGVSHPGEVTMTKFTGDAEGLSDGEVRDI